jgi:hypothetical protein
MNFNPLLAPRIRQEVERLPQPRPGFLDPVKQAAESGQLVKEGGIGVEGVNRGQEDIPGFLRPSQPVQGGRVVEPPGAASGVKLDDRDREV